jgi:hypothetical protein
MLTKHSLMQASVLEEFVDQKSLLAFEAAAAELDEVAVLDTCDECHFVQEFVVPLLRLCGELLHGHLRPIWKNSLKHKEETTSSYVFLGPAYTKGIRSWFLSDHGTLLFE